MASISTRTAAEPRKYRHHRITTRSCALPRGGKPSYENTVPRSRPHDSPACQCRDCQLWDTYSQAAPLSRCAETHLRDTDFPCLHGFTHFCPSFMHIVRVVYP